MNLVPQFGFLELILIAIVALIVVGPKDLPMLMRSAGRFVAKAKALAGEFTAAFDQMARESEMEELRKEIDTLKNDNVIAKTKRELEEELKPASDELRKETSEINKAANQSKASESTATTDKPSEEAAQS